MSFSVIGLNSIERQIKKLKDPDRVLEPAFKKSIAQSLGKLKDTMPRDEGSTADAWVARKKRDSFYVIENKRKTEDKKHFIVNILDKGRRAVYPVRSRKLYIPLTKTGRKKLGAKIPENAVYGKDYQWADKVKAYKGTRFIQKELKAARKFLKKQAKLVLKKV